MSSRASAMSRTKTRISNSFERKTVNRTDRGALVNFTFTDRDFDRLRGLVRELTGISLSEQKRELVYGRLTRRLRALSFSSFKDYCDFLEQNLDLELEHFTNSITTNLTSFFRENHHFEMIASDPLKSWLMNRLGMNGKLRFWSAGSSTGEEAYSLAITLAETIPDVFNKNVKILATDLDTNVINTGHNGVYPENRIDALSGERKKKWFQRGSGDSTGMVKVDERLRSMVTFNQLNLMGEWPMRGPFDVIFCRNVVIYFDKPTQGVLFNRYADILCDDGVLFIGHSETMAEVCTRFDLVGKTMYRKIC